MRPRATVLIAVPVAQKPKAGGSAATGRPPGGPWRRIAEQVTVAKRLRRAVHDCQAWRGSSYLCGCRRSIPSDKVGGQGEFCCCRIPGPVHSAYQFQDNTRSGPVRPQGPAGVHRGKLAGQACKKLPRCLKPARQSAPRNINAPDRSEFKSAGAGAIMSF